MNCTIMANCIEKFCPGGGYSINTLIHDSVVDDYYINHGENYFYYQEGRENYYD